MSKPWLHIIGIGEDGVNGLSAAARHALEQAEAIIGGARHHALTPDFPAKRISWPSPFSLLSETITAFRGHPLAVLVSGDPMWFSAGNLIAGTFPAEEICFHPQLSSFQLAAIRMGWPLQSMRTLSVHGRPVETIIPYVEPGARLALLTGDGSAPAAIAALLQAGGFGPSRMSVLAAMGGPNELRIDGRAAEWTQNTPDLHVLCIECQPEPGTQILPRTAGLPDSAFEHDGKMTKREVRALTLARLAPAGGALLWDIGAGCGSVSIEWMRAASGACAIAIEPHTERRKLAAANARTLGVPGLQLIDGHAPGALKGLPRPDAIFIGGGLTRETVTACREALRPGGRFVINAVTLESEVLLAGLHQEMGGELTKIAISHASAMGNFRSWRPQMAVTQWSIVL